MFCLCSALNSLTDATKKKLIEKEEKRKMLLQLHESVQALSTNDMLKLFYDDMQGRLIEQGKNAQKNPGRGCEENIIENYIQEFTSLVADSPIMKVQLLNDQ